MAITFNHNDQVYVKDGKMGIGINNPGGVLDVDGTYGDLKIGDPSIGSRITYYDITRILLNSNHIIFYTNSLTERMRITSGGNVGIGTTSPDGKLHLEGNFESNKALVIKGTYGTGTEYYFKTHGVNSEILALYADGTRAFNFRSTTISTPLNFAVSGTVQFANYASGILEVDGSGNLSVDTSTYLTSYTETQTLDDVTTLGATTTNSITVGQVTIDKTADNTKIAFNSHSTLQGATAEIGVSREDFSTSKSHMSFYTNDGSGLSLAMRIKESGKIGIGTTNPGSILHIQGDGSGILELTRNSGTPHIFFKNTANTGYGRIYISDDLFQISAGTSTKALDFAWIQGDSNGNIAFPQYGAGILKTDASGNISLDTSTYLT